MSRIQTISTLPSFSCPCHGSVTVIFPGFISSFFSPKSCPDFPSRLTQGRVELVGRKPACCRPWLWMLPDNHHQLVSQGQLLGTGRLSHAVPAGVRWGLPAVLQGEPLTAVLPLR